MATEHEEKPFLDVLEELFTVEPIPIHYIYRLSDMAEAEFRAFQQRWEGAPDIRRSTLLRHMTDLTEENFVVDFTPIFTYCFADPAAAVRLAALDGMWDATDVGPVPQIVEMMQTDKDERVRAAAAQALAHYVLMAEWGQLPRRILPPVVEALLQAYEDAATAVPVKRAALEALGSANHPRVAGFIREAYEIDHLPTQLSAIFAMGRTADRQWVPILLAEMESIHPEMRAEAARAIGDIGSSDALDLLEKLVYDEDRDVQLAAISALGTIGGETATEILDELAQDEESDELLVEAIEDAMEEMAMLAGEMDYFDWLDDEDENDDPHFHPN